MTDKWETVTHCYICNGTVEEIQVEGTSLLCLTTNGVERVNIYDHILPKKEVEE